MQDNLMQVQTQPFVKFAQANMDLFAQFSTSPEVTAQAGANASQLYQQASESAMKIMQSGAFSQMMQGLLNNYAEFLTELSKSGMAMLNQGQAVMSRQVHESTAAVVDAADVRSRRAHQAA